MHSLSAWVVQADIIMFDCRMLCIIQDLPDEDRKQAEEDGGRKDMHWKINVEVHDPDIGLVRVVAVALSYCAPCNVEWLAVYLSRLICLASALICALVRSCFCPSCCTCIQQGDIRISLQSFVA